MGMNFKSMLGNLECGPVDGFNISHLGLAVKNAAGDMVSYDKTKDEIVNVDLIDFEGKGMVWAMPCAIKDVAKGDVLRHVNGNPVFVTSIEGGIHVVDVAASEKKEIMPVKSMFGFDFVVKYISLFDSFASTASNDNPFGNMLPLMMFSDNTNMKDILLPMLLLSGNGQAPFNFLDMSNPLLLMALMGDEGGSEGKNFFQLILTMQMMNQKKGEETNEIKN